MLPRIRKILALNESLQASPAFPSDESNIKTNMSVKEWSNDTRENRSNLKKGRQCTCNATLTRVCTIIFVVEKQ